MKHAYLIMAHNQWEVLEQLLIALDHPNNDIYLHIDKKASPPCEHLRSIVSRSRLVFTKRYNIVWGGTQMMKCTLAMLNQAAQTGYSHYHFFSGMDFPIKSQRYIHNFFRSHPEQQFISFDWPGIQDGRFLYRTQYYHFLIDIIGKRDNHSMLYRLLAKAEDISLAVQRKLGVNRSDYVMYKGSSWFSINHSLACAIVRESPNISRRYAFTANADEIWLQTFVKESSFDEELADSNMHYIRWIQGNPSPETLTMADYDDLMRSDKLFARKFDWNTDKEVVMKIKDHILKDTLV